jgi:putative DNA primase/helicase
MRPNGNAAQEIEMGARGGDAPHGQPIDDVEADAKVVYLAGLPDLAYGRERRKVADSMGLSVTWLDKIVRSKRAEIVASAVGNTDAETGGRGRPINLPEPEPWPDVVDGAALLSAIAKAVSRYMVMEPGAADCVALWAMHSHALDAFGITPRLAITSPRPQCGKTTLLDILYRLVFRPLLAGNVSAASVFRVVEFARPTLLVDEADTFLPGNDELRGVLNSGHRHGGSVIRVVGEAMEVREFSTFAPAAIAMIGHLPGTLVDRSISITLKRKRADELVDSFRYDRTQEFYQLACMCARWAADNIGRLREADPVVPANLYNRAADNWQPLLAIADAAGGGWPERARKLASATVDADQAKRIGLLADIRDVFNGGQEKGGAVKAEIKSADLVSALVAMEGHPWAEYGKNGKPLSPNSLARMLANDHISPDTIRFADGSLAKGYRRSQFEDAFARYLPEPPISNRNTVTTEDSCGLPAKSQPLQVDGGYGSYGGQNHSVSAECYGVTVENQGELPKSTRVRVRL